MRTLLGKSDFYWPLMVLAEQWQCSLCANVLSVHISVPTMFPLLLANGRVTNGRVPPFPILRHSIAKSVEVQKWFRGQSGQCQAYRQFRQSFQ